MPKIDENLVEELDDFLVNLLDDNSKKKIKKEIDNLLYIIEGDLEYELLERLRSSLSGHTREMAEKAIDAILNGDENRLRQYLSCYEYSYTGREHNHEVIHGTLFETGAIALRKKIVDAYPELLKNERILDLEAQLNSVIKQVVQEKARADSYYERFRP